jgi:hypothetical protein
LTFVRQFDREVVAVRSSAVARRFCGVALLLLGVAALASAAPSRAQASTDVMFVFDTTGSMGGALNEAQEEIQEAMTQIGSSLPDAQFGLAEMRDYSEVNFNGFPEEGEEGEEFYDLESGFQPWTLMVPITSNQSLVAEGLEGLFANGGGDGPEAYGRALYETDVNPAVGWRPGARGVIVLVADNVPHDAELNEGIPSTDWYQSPFNTSPDPGRDNTLGTGDDLDWQNVVLPSLISDGRPLEYVDYFGLPEFFPYWQNWTARTGGSALQANGESLAGQIVELVKAGASAPLPPCPGGKIRDASGHCGTPPPPPPPPPLPPSNHFKFDPRISCAGVCHVVLVKITFDSAGNVIAESIPEEEASSSAAQASAKKKSHKKKAKPQFKRLAQPVSSGLNTLKLKLTPTAQKTLKKKGKLNMKARITFTPNGGTASTQTQTFHVKLLAKHKKKSQK